MLTLEIEDISKEYKVNTLVLHNISETITTGLLVVSGPNGSGKTTLLRLLAGILRPTSGRILFNGSDISRDYGFKQSLGYLPQEFGFYPEMTGRDFLNYMARLKGLPQSLCSARVAEVAECVGVWPVLNRVIGEWSAGQRRRLGIAQAILNDPDVIIMDEPMVGLDPEEKLYFWQYFSNLAKSRIVIISSNILIDYTIFADKALVLINGVNRFWGYTRNLLNIVGGKVWVADVPVKVGELLKEKWIVSAMHFVDNVCRIRVVSDKKPDIPGVQLAQPCMKDAYVYLVRCEVHKE